MSEDRVTLHSATEQLYKALRDWHEADEEVSWMETYTAGPRHRGRDRAVRDRAWAWQRVLNALAALDAYRPPPAD